MNATMTARTPDVCHEHTTSVHTALASGAVGFWKITVTQNQGGEEFVALVFEMDPNDATGTPSTFFHLFGSDESMADPLPRADFLRLVAALNAAATALPILPAR